MNAEARLKNCTFVKTVSMLFVVLGHSIAFWSGSWFTGNPVFESSVLKCGFDFINTFHIYAFTLVSGYIFAYKMIGGGYSSYAALIKSKAKRLLVPYVFVATVWVVPFSEFYFKLNVKQILIRYVLCTNPSQLWFLWMLFWVFVMVWPIWKYIANSPLTGWITVIGFYCIGVLGAHLLPDIFCIFTGFQYVIFFYIGMRIRINEESNKTIAIEKVHWSLWVVAHIGLFVAGLYFNAKSGLVFKVISVFLGLATHIVGAITVFVVLQKIATHVKTKGKVFQKLSLYSMPTYLFHQQIIYITISILNGRINPYIHATVNFLLAIAVSVAISSILMRFKVTRFLIGEK